MRSQIDTLVILDRAVDLVSPLPIQLTYEGLIDEMFGIQCSSVRLPENKVVSLSSAEELYGELRGLNFNAVGPSLARKARSLAVAEGERHEARNVRELKQFVDKLPGMQVFQLKGYVPGVSKCINDSGGKSLFGNAHNGGRACEGKD